MEMFNKNAQESNNQQCGETHRRTSDKVGYVVGQVVGTVLCACVVAAVIALTTKFIFWLF